MPFFGRQDETIEVSDSESDAPPSVPPTPPTTPRDDASSDIGPDEEVAAITSRIEKEYEENRAFQRQARETFVSEWLNCEGDWLKTLDKQHLDFLRDILGVPRTYEPTWPSYKASN